MSKKTEAARVGRTPRKLDKNSGGILKIKQIGSVIGCTDRQRATVRGLGLRRMNQVVERQDTPEIRGMVRAVPHLVGIVE
jgi:large subunit ribosomal protein L30